MGRNRIFETEFLGQAERRAGLMDLGFPRQVLERLDTVGAQHGDRFESMGLARLFNEIREEGLDVAGWAALAGQVAMRTDLDPDHRLELLTLLESIAGHGVHVERAVRRLYEVVAE